MNELALFAGAGGGILGGHLLGWRTVCAVELDAYARSVLLARQRDGLLPRFPVWDDVRTFDGKPWARTVHVVSGGFPCTDISVAGAGAGIDGPESGLWRDMARVVREVRPRFVYVENSPALTARGLGTVLGDLASMGFDARWGVLGADNADAPHERKRLWILADAYSFNRGEVWRSAPRQGGHAGEQAGRDRGAFDFIDWPREPDVGRVVDGVPRRVERLRALGNAQVPRVAAAAWRMLTAGTRNTHNAELTGPQGR
jgi:DNA (cytosine-5)-methyltransferase 1